MWNCPKCVKPQTLLDQVLKFEDFWQQVYFVPYTQIYHYTSVAYEGLEIGLFFNSAKSKLTFIRVEPITVSVIECPCGAKREITPINSGVIFIKAIQFFKKVIKPLPSPHIKSCETLIRFTEEAHTRNREEVIRDYVLRNIRRTYIDKREDESWLLWFRP